MTPKAPMTDFQEMPILMLAAIVVMIRCTDRASQPAKHIAVVRLATDVCVCQIMSFGSLQLKTACTAYEAVPACQYVHAASRKARS